MIKSFCIGEREYMLGNFELLMKGNLTILFLGSMGISGVVATSIREKDNPEFRLYQITPPKIYQCETSFKKEDTPNYRGAPSLFYCK